MHSEGSFISSMSCKLMFRAFAAIFLLQLSVPAFAADQRQAERLGVVRARVVTSARMPYLAITPANFRGQSRWPLIVFLHGGDESGTDLNRIKIYGPPRFALANSNFPFVVVAPLLQAGKLWEAGAVVSLVKQVSARFRIDTSRVYLTGLSTGGYGTWKTGLAYPEYFAAIVPVSGGGSSEILKHADGEKLQALRSLPVWAFHGGSDAVINVDESQRMVSGLQGIGNRGARLTTFSGAPHDIWNRVYDDPALYDWLLLHQR